MSQSRICTPHTAMSKYLNTVMCGVQIWEFESVIQDTGGGGLPPSEAPDTHSKLNMNKI